MLDGPPGKVYHASPDTDFEFVDVEFITEFKRVSTFVFEYGDRAVIQPSLRLIVSSDAASS